MAHPALPVALLALAAPAAASLGEVPGDRVELAQLTIHERIVIRVPRLGRPDQPPADPIRWKEKKGPKCVQADDMAGALVISPTLVDLVLVGGKRVRARLDRDCKPLDFYSGFYMRPAADGMICRGRDAIRVRSGASCTIDDFRTLVPRR